MGSHLREDQQRVKTLLANTVKLLCEKGLAFSHSLKVQGLIGITIDDHDVFIVHMNENVENSFRKATGMFGNSNASDIMGSPMESSFEGPSHSQHSMESRSRAIGSLKTVPQTLSQPVMVEAEPCIIIKPEPVENVIDLESSHNDLPSVYQENGSRRRTISNNIRERDHEPPSKRRASMPHTSTPPVTSPIRSVDSDASLTEPSLLEPYITGIVPNVAETMRKAPERSPAWESCAGYQLSKIASQIAKATVSKPNAEESPSGDSLFRMSDMYDSTCAACQHYVRRVKHNGERQKLKRRGVPESELPKFLEHPIPPDTCCQVCIRRKQYFREKSLLHERRKRARVYPT